jgi:uncharacterized membrane protein HdeD (DUF308 family)
MTHIDDDGFTQRVLARLPPRRSPQRWRIRITLGALVLSGGLCLALGPPLAGLIEEMGVGLLALVAAGAVLLVAAERADEGA